MKTFLILLGSIFILMSCVKNNENVVWLKVSSWQLLDNPASVEYTGVLTENISDAWVYVDDKLVGIFEVPFKVPFLLPGNNKKITIYPTIRNNGISATKKIYPFLEPYEITLDLLTNDTVEINPVTQYYSATKFHVLDFEDGPNMGFEAGANTIANIGVSTDPLVLESLNETQFGRVSLNSSFNYWSARTKFEAVPAFPQLGAEIYLEIDYHSTVGVVTGVVSFHNGEVSENPNVQFNGQDPTLGPVVWKKIYIDMQTIISGSPAGSDFEITFESILPDSLATGEINIDNIKVVHF